MFAMEIEAERRREVIAGPNRVGGLDGERAQRTKRGWRRTTHRSVRTIESRPCEESVVAGSAFGG
jgi:hypothetical protein